MEAFYEQNLINEKIDAHIKRTRALVIVNNVLWGLGFAILFFVVIFTTILKSFIYFLFGLLFCVPFLLSAFLLYTYIKKANCEYDYILTGDTLRIVRVVRRLKRKLIEAIPLSLVISIGGVQNESYDKNFASKDIKKKFAICDYDAVDNIAYILYKKDGEKIMTHIQPDEGLIAALRKCLPRIGIIDKSLYTPAGGEKA